MSDLHAQLVGMIDDYALACWGESDEAPAMKVALSAALREVVDALNAARAALTDPQLGTWQYMEGSEIYNDFREAVVKIDAAIDSARSTK